MRKFLNVPEILLPIVSALILVAMYDVMVLSCRLVVWLGTVAKGIPNGW